MKNTKPAAAAAAKPKVPRKTPQARPKASKGPAGPQQLHLSPVAQAYAATLLNPCGCPGSGMPLGSALPSRKFQVFCRGSFSTNATTGFGCATLAPAQAITSAGTPVVATTNAYALAVVPAAGAGGTIIIPSNSEYGFGSVGPTVGTLQYRVVAACIRARCTANALQMSGSMRLVMHPDHGSLVGYTDTQLLAFASCTSMPVTREWIELLWTGPVVPNETDYAAGVTTLDNASIAPCLVIEVTAPSALSPLMTFDVEGWIELEAIGSNVQGKTPSYVDMVGANLVNNAAISLSDRAGGYVNHGEPSGIIGAFTSALADVAKHTLTSVSQGAVRLGVQAVASGLAASMASRAPPTRLRLEL